jgi:hypothetical protein
MKFLIGFTCFLLITSCTSKNNTITGNWKRVGGGNKGMIISLQKVGDGYEAKILVPPSQYSLFAAGDLKWKNVIEKSRNYYQYQDLFKSVTGSSYRDSYFNLIGDTIKTRVFSKTDYSDSEEQVWARTDTLLKK